MSSVRVTVVRALSAQAQIRPLELPAGATVADALFASGLVSSSGPAESPSHGAATGPSAAPAVGIFGRRVDLSQVLVEGDQVELYRPLSSAPGERRRARAKARQAGPQGTGL